MHPRLFQAGSFDVSGYAAAMLLAILVALGTLLWRTRRLAVDAHVISVVMLVAVVGGWMGSRGLPLLLPASGSAADWSRLLPTEQAGHSATGFLLGCLPALVLLAAWKRREAWRYADAIGPSLLLALALAKVGCLLAGCCFGRPCNSVWGLPYPYGSLPYTRHLRKGWIDCPAALLRPRADGQARPWPHVRSLRNQQTTPPAILVEHASRHGMTYTQWLSLAAAQRSLPVWPVPVLYFIAASAGWFIAECCLKRAARRPGLLTGGLLTFYGLLRLALDFFLDAPFRAWGLTGAQYASLLVVTTGLGVIVVVGGKRGAWPPCPAVRAAGASGTSAAGYRTDRRTP
jgi:prolipoprotein diacylglyceryltransferase